MTRVDTETEKKEMLRNIEELEAAENRKDIEGILALLTEDMETRCCLPGLVLVFGAKWRHPVEYGRRSNQA